MKKKFIFFIAFVCLLICLFYAKDFLNFFGSWGIVILMSLILFVPMASVDIDEFNFPEESSKRSRVTTFGELQIYEKFVITDKNHPEAGRLLEKNCYGFVDRVCANRGRERYDAEDLRDITSVMRIS